MPSRQPIEDTVTAAFDALDKQLGEFVHVVARPGPFIPHVLLQRQIEEYGKQRGYDRSAIENVATKMWRTQKQKLQYYHRLRAPAESDAAARLAFQHDADLASSFNEMLRGARALYEQDLESASAGWHSCRLALSIAVLLLNRIPVANAEIKAVVQPLQMLEAALRDLAAGDVHPALQPAAKPANRSTSASRRLFETKCKLAVWALVECGDPEDQAIRTVVSRGEKAAATLSKAHVYNFSTRKVKRWFDEFRRSVKKIDDVDEDLWSYEQTAYSFFCSVHPNDVVGLRRRADAFLNALSVGNIHLSLFQSLPHR